MLNHWGPHLPIKDAHQLGCIHMPRASGFSAHHGVIQFLVLRSKKTLGIFIAKFRVNMGSPKLSFNADQHMHMITMLYVL